MAILYGKRIGKETLLKKVGSISQVAGIKRYTLLEGRGKGVEAADVKTGSGFSFTVLPSRGMDISFAQYNGKSLCWRSQTGDVAPSYYEPEELEWLRSFYGGLLLTCGLTQAGMPCIDNEEKLGLHGRISNIPATDVSIQSEWKDDDYIMKIKGKIIQAKVFGENICLTREITARLGESRLFVYDVVENLGFEDVPHMILYHINGGYPAVDEGSSLIAQVNSVSPRDDEAKIEQEKYNQFSRPIHGFKERVYYLDMAEDKDGFVTAALVNKTYDNGEGFGFYIRYLKKELPRFIEWKMNGEGTYVVGIEPANCMVGGRAKEREAKTLQFMKPGEKREYHLEIGVLSGKESIEKYEEQMR
ncbi:MAG: aldose 1-epimerase family protein [bacterium]|nr:aldose 1-epimerase family protein [bacterium]